MKKYFIKPGDRFGMLTVISEESRKEKGVTRRYVKVRCNCWTVDWQSALQLKRQ